MEYCPFCKTDKPNILTKDELRSLTIPQVKQQMSYFERVLKEAIPTARHWNHMKRRAISRLERFAEELDRRKHTTKGTRHARKKNTRKAA